MPIFARWLGLSGLLPLMVAVALLGFVDDAGLNRRVTMLALAYSTLILSFLGGLWWGLAAANGSGAVPGWVWLAAVMPSLYAWGAVGLAVLAVIDVRQALAVVGGGLLLTLLVDRALAEQGLAPPWWLALRYPLSLGLGGLSLAAAAIA